MRMFAHMALAIAIAFASAGVAPRAARADHPASPTADAKEGVDPRSTAFEAETGRVVVGFDPAREERVVAAVERLGGTVERTSDGLSVVVLEPPDDAHADAFADVLSELPGVEYAETEHYSYAMAAPNDPLYPMQWGLAAMGLPAARGVTIGAQSVVVAVLDTGLGAHSDGPVHVAGGYDFVQRDPNPQDENGHGTHVAGTIAAATNNLTGMAAVAPGVTILPVRVLNAAGAGANSDVAEGIRWAADRGAHVINLSLGSSSDDSVVREACEYARSRGCLIVAASGNGGSGTVAYPACYPGVIAVGAIGQGGGRPSFSQYGLHLDLVAPGQDILSLKLGGGGVPLSGTSMAAPHVSATAALVRSVATTWTAEMVRQCLIATATDIGPWKWDGEYGYGLVRADTAAALAAHATDNAVPGIPAPALRFDDSVSATDDPHDVRFLQLDEGATIQAAINSPNPALELRLLGPGQTHASPTPWALAAGTPGSPIKSLSFTVPAGAGGTWYLHVRAPSGSGAYRVDYAVGVPTVMSVSAPSTCAWGGSVKVTGVLKKTTSAPVTSRQVVIEARPSGASAWSAVGQTTTSASGSFTVSVRPKKKTAYRAVFRGEDGAFLSVTSAAKTATPKAYLPSPKAPSKIRKGRTFTVTGSLRPKHTAGKKTVRIMAYRRVRGKYRYVKSFYAVNKKYTAATTKYSQKVKLTSRGKWKLVAKVKGDSLHATTSSTARYVTVY